jgi:hypothetical protein
MRYVRRAAVVVAIMMLAGHAAALAAPSKNNAFASLPGPGQVRPPAFVGHDDAEAISVALVLIGPDEVVAYACDGTGKVGVWFSGSIDAGEATLQSSDEASTLTYSFRDGAGTLTLRGETSTFSLERATGIAGLYRESSSKGKQRTVLGWIVGNDGLVVGEATVNGKAVLAVSENVSQPPPDDATATTTTLAATTRSFVTTVRCGILDFRLGFNRAQGVSAAGDAEAFADAAADDAAIKAKRNSLGC